MDRNVETKKRRGNVLATTSTQSRKIQSRMRFGGKERGRGAKKVSLPFSRASFLLSFTLPSSRCHSRSRTFPLPTPRLVPTWHPKFALRNPPGWFRRPPSIHPSVLCPEKSQRSPLLLARPNSSRTNNTRHARVTLHARVYTPLIIYS